MEAIDRGEAEAGKELLCEHVHLENEARIQAAKLAPMQKVDWGEAQEADAVLATCRRWLCTHKDTPFPRRDALLKKYLGASVDTEKGCTLFHLCNSLVHCDVGHQGQQRTLALMQEWLWWPMMVDDCQALV